MSQTESALEEQHPTQSDIARVRRLADVIDRAGGHGVARALREAAKVLQELLSPHERERDRAPCTCGAHDHGRGSR